MDKWRNRKENKTVKHKVVIQHLYTLLTVKALSFGHYSKSS